MGTPQTHKATDIGVYTLGVWESVNRVRTAIYELEIGIFTNAALLAEVMMRDDRLSGVFLQRFGGVLSSDLTMGEPKDGKESDIAKEALDSFPKMFPTWALRSWLTWGHMLGAGPAELLWEKTDKRWMPRIKIWHPKFLYWHQNERVFKLTTAEGLVDMEPGNGQWMLYTPHGEYRGWMGGLIRSLFIPWLIRQFALRDWARYSEAHGMPIKKAHVPAGAEEADKKRFMMEVGKIANDLTVRVPEMPEGQGKFDLTLLEAVGDTHDGFDKLITKCETALTIRVLGQNLTTEVGKNGSKAAAQVHQTIRADILEEDAKTLSETIHDQALTWWAQHNFGNRDLAPKPKWETEPPEDQAERGTALKNLGDGIKSLQLTGAQVNVDELMEANDIPTTGPAKDPQPEPQPGLPGQKPAPGKPRPSAQASRKPKGYIEGQMYVDDLVDHGVDQGSSAVSLNLLDLVHAVDEGADYEDIRRRLLQRYKGMDPTRLSALVHKVLVLSELNGMLAVLEDL